MLRTTATACFTVLGLALLAAPALAQDDYDYDGSQEKMTFAKRLNRIRRTIVGEPAEEAPQPPAKSSKSSKGHVHPKMARQDARPAQAASPKPNAKPSSSRRDAVASPSARRTQSAEPRRSAASNAAVPKVASNAIDLARRSKEKEQRATRSTVPRAERSTPTTTARRKQKSGTSSDQGASSEKIATSGGKLLISGQGPQLSVETTGPKRLVVGQEADYKITVRNEGKTPAASVIVAIGLPGSAEVGKWDASAGQAERGNAAIEWSIGNLAAGDDAELVLPIVARESRSFDLAVRWSAASPSAQATVEVQEPKLDLRISGPKEVRCDAKEIYRLTVSNPGSADADDVVIRLLPLDGDDGEPTSHRVGTVGAGESEVVEIELVARQGGPLKIQAEATAAGGLKAEAVEQVTVRRAALELMVAGPKKQFSGAAATYEIGLKNPGDSTTEQLEITAQLPADTEFVSATSTGHFDESTGRVTWKLDRLSAGAEETLALKCVLQSSGQSRVDVTAKAEGIQKQTASVTTKIVAVADIVLEVTDPSGPVSLGADAVYEIRVRNRGKRQADGVDIVAFFAKGVEPVSVEGGSHEIAPGTVLFEPIESLEAGGQRVFKIHAKAESAGTHLFRVELKCKATGTNLAQEETTLYYGDEVEETGEPGRIPEEAIDE